MTLLGARERWARRLPPALKRSALYAGVIAVLIGAPSCGSLNTAPVASEDALPGLLTKWRAAVPQTAEWNAYRVEGEYSAEGMRGPFVLDVERDGRFRQETRTRLGHVTGYDGESAWSADLAGVARPADFSAGPAMVAAVWIRTGAWLSSEQARFEYTLLETSAAETTLLMRQKGGEWRARMRVDTETGAPLKLVETGAGAGGRITLSDWRTVNGIRYPYSVVRSSTNGLRARFVATSINAAPPTNAERYDAPNRTASDTVFDSEQPSLVTIRRTRNGHLVARPKINGRSVGWFLLDTGAGTLCIDHKVADAAELEAFGSTIVSGTGGARASQFRHAARLTLGPMAIHDAALLEIDLSFLRRATGLPVAGILGYDFFARAIVVVDATAETLEILAPNTPPNDPALRWESVRFDGTKPCVKARFSGENGWFRVDSGSDTTLTIHGPSARRIKQMSARQGAPITAVGVGGPLDLERFELDSFELGGRLFSPLSASAFRGRTGPLADENTAGLIGAGLLNQFRLIWDYSRKRVAWLEPAGD